MQIAGQGHVAAIIPVEARMRVMLRASACAHSNRHRDSALHAQVMQVMVG
ncbi:hypothetical protein MEA186_11986 [Mesorhizobium amorphae CCNWGS0123]|uniref:Uncharacterized protein n=1 Tax=Mesorhizobium amorphae CCNWGS0123 TaxID=1082933 RepID=G6Y8X8_9HYPH|nr:hypothetical protein MEA186_11986 [Mesorhizobium amorphae CCNWGS0123]